MPFVLTMIHAGDALVRHQTGDRPSWAVVRDGFGVRLELTLTELLRRPIAEARAALGDATGHREAIEDDALLSPLESQEVWAAGVTYARSREARGDESNDADLYERVYYSERPELFFKARGERVVGPGGTVRIRGDSPWNVPEPELALVLNSRLEVFGFTVGNDVSSRSIEGENPLYLPQAKLYDDSCGLGPAIVPVWTAGPAAFGIEMIVRREEAVAFRGSTSTERMARGFRELVAWLGRANSFPEGAVLLTGTGIVPGAEFTLLPGMLWRSTWSGSGVS